MSAWASTALITFLFASIAPRRAEAQPTIVDPNFVHEVLYTGNGMISFAFGPGGRLYVCEKQGRVLTFRPDGAGGFSAPVVFADLRSSVDATGEAGLLGMAIDPAFSTNRHLYLFYTTASDQRLVRVTADSAYDAMVSGSLAVILSGLPRQFVYHKAGNIAFHPLDPNNIYISLGDDNQISSVQDPAQYPGKILKVAKADGGGLPDNPYQDGNMSSIRSRVWAVGFRNPFRFTFHPNTPVADVLYSSENGNSTDRLSWVRKGSNGSWSSAGDGGGFLNPPDANHRVMATDSPYLIGVAIVRGGPFADPSFPSSDAIYLANGAFSGGAIKRWRLTGANLDGLSPFGSDLGQPFATGVQAVHLAFGPDGALYFTATSSGEATEGTHELARIRRVGGSPPVAAFSTSPSPARGPAPLSVSFSDGSSDSDGTISAWYWTFGDGTTSTAQHPTHVFSSPGSYTTTLEVTDDDGMISTTSAVVEAVAATTLTITGRIFDGRNYSNQGLPVATELRIYQSDGTTRIGSRAVIAAGGWINVTRTVELNGDSVVLSVGENTTGFRPAYFAFQVPAGASTHRIDRNYFLSDTAIRGTVRDTRGAPAQVDIGVARGSAGSRYAIPGGRDYLAGSGVPASGVLHRVTSDLYGRYYVPIPSGGGGTTFYLDLPADTNANIYRARTDNFSVAAGTLVSRDLVVGLIDGGLDCDDLGGIASVATDYETMVQSIWNAQCTGCHNGGSGSSGGLILEPGLSRAALVDRPSAQVPGISLVRAADLEASYLIEKISCAEPQSGTRMRPGDPMILADQARIRDWIMQGARSSPADPDTAAPSIANGAGSSVTMAPGADLFFKIFVYPGATSLNVTIDDPACSSTTCAFDGDLYLRRAGRPTDTIYDCRPARTNSDESCLVANPTAGWWFMRLRARAGSGSLVLTPIHDGTGAAPANLAPGAAFTASTSGLTVSLDASVSRDTDGDALSYTWSFGDGTTGSGVTTSHTYASGGAKTITVTASDGRGGSASATRTITVTSTGGGGDPDPSTPTIAMNTIVNVAVPANGSAYRKVSVPAGRSTLIVDMRGPSCTTSSCPFSADISVRFNQRPTDSSFACRPAVFGNNETCTINVPAAGWWYIRARSVQGSGTVMLRAQ